ncbi:fam-a protein [Plasmodium yoelii]|uniref:Fam-a protein n=2 Tax=Plasmodium yoelii TaxID=5861 RepID=A0AAE9WNK1_PLAYO|nr:fam-a protein [Plasmodium yoelii]WBY57055.1 fam-a protein [Plasmodium yoelii yoelii]VTZ78172.1 fam-a protein [Plasmodium yoelii]|eukprot:XP_034493482.1 fam-a protein [Plasmodium yoelii]
MNKGYIKIALPLLSLAGYTQNVTFATGHPSDVTINANPSRQKPLFEEFPELTCEDLDEALVALDHANDASEFLIKLSETGIDDYSTHSTKNGDKIIYSKKIGNMDIGRLHLTIPSASNYSNVLRKLWDFNHNKKPDERFINGKLARVYCNYLIVLEKLSIDPNYTPLTKKYALAARVKHSNDTTVILCPSRPLNYLGQNDGEPNMNEILENTQSIQTDIDPEEALTKLSANVAGFVVKKGEDNVQVTYINAIYDAGNSTDFDNDKRERELAYTNILSLPQRI